MDSSDNELGQIWIATSLVSTKACFELPRLCFLLHDLGWLMSFAGAIFSHLVLWCISKTSAPFPIKFSVGGIIELKLLCMSG